MNCTHGTLKPLHCACMVADADCVELLLQKGAEVKAFKEEKPRSKRKGPFETGPGSKEAAAGAGKQPRSEPVV